MTSPIGKVYRAPVATADGTVSFSLDIELPRGFETPSTPQLSFNYSQSIGDGLLGLGWSLGGIDAIQRMPQTLAVDGANAPLSIHDSDTRFALAGMELLLLPDSPAPYGKPDATYSTEINSGITVRDTGTGFVAIDKTGNSREYGMTPDSRMLCNDNRNVREWYISRVIDAIGNYTTYRYNAQAAIELISFTSNDKAGLKAGKFVEFTYQDRDQTDRNDIVRVTGAGELVTITQRLQKVFVYVQRPSPGAPRIPVRTYDIKYERDANARFFTVREIVESGSDGTPLPPTSFTYTSQTPISGRWFNPGPVPSMQLSSSGTTGTALQLISFGISGNGIADLVGIRKNSAGYTQVIPHLASILGRDAFDNLQITWPPMRQPLPGILPQLGSDPVILSADLNGDGQSDLIAAYQAGLQLNFAVLRATSAGFAGPDIIQTGLAWEPGSKFLAMDSNGNGKTDIVQLRPLARISPRVIFFDRDSAGHCKMRDFVDSPAGQPSQNTREWLVADATRDGVQDLLRIWEDSQKPGQINVTTYVGHVPQNQKTIYREASTLSLGSYTSQSLQDLRLRQCDINGDGVQDLIVCQTKQTAVDKVSFSFQTFLCDGIGGFKELPKQPPIEVRTSNLGDPSKRILHVVDIDKSGIPSLIYQYQTTDANWDCHIFQGSSAGDVAFRSSQRIADVSQLPSRDAKLQLVDLDGTGKHGWLAWSIVNNEFCVRPFFNVRPPAGYLQQVVTPLGQLTSFKYRAVTDPEVYERGDATHTSASDPGAMANVSSFGRASFVIAQIDAKGEPDLKMTKTYKNGLLNTTGRGWLGFGEICTIDHGQNGKPIRKVIENFYQEFPCTGLQKKVSTYGVESLLDSSGNKDLKGLEGTMSLLRTHETDFRGAKAPGNAFWTVKKHTDETCVYSGDLSGNTAVALRTRHEYDYDSDLNVVRDKQTTASIDNPTRDDEIFILSEYTSIGHTRGLITAQKRTTIGTNTDLSRFQTGDISLSLMDLDPGVFKPSKQRDYCTSNGGGFREQSMSYDLVGNACTQHLPGGTRIDTIYDQEFFSFPLIQRESDLPERLLAWDFRFGTKVAEQSPEGPLDFFDIDSIGRTVRKLVNSPSGAADSLVLDTGTLEHSCASSELIAKTSATSFVPVTQTSYALERDGGRLWPKRVEVSIASDINDTGGNTIHTTYFNPFGEACRHAVVNGDSSKAIWTCSFRDHFGNPSIDSRPTFALDGISLLSWIPKLEECQQIIYDAVGRPLLAIGPSDRNLRQCTFSQHERGGLVITSLEGICEPDGKFNALKKIVNKHEAIAGGLKLVETTVDETNSSSFSYDLCGNLRTAVDPGGKVEYVTSDNLGNILEVNNVYQNQSGTSGTYATTKRYDEMNRVLREVNILGNAIDYTYNLQGQLLTRHSTCDKRSIAYKYSRGQLSQVTINLDDAMESQYDFEYDSRARPCLNRLTLASGDIFETKYRYDRQDRLIEKKMPDGTISSTHRTGSLPTLFTLGGISAEIQASTASGNVTDWSIKGNGTKLTGHATFDGLERLESRYLTKSGQTTVASRSYTYDNLNRISSVVESSGGSPKTTSYNYSGNRLSSSKADQNVEKTYHFDKSGNILQMGSLMFSQSSLVLTAKANDKEVYKAVYDAAGRMVERMLDGSTYEFTWNSFNKLQQARDHSTGNATCTFTTDHRGETVTTSYADDSIEIRVSPDFRVTKHADGTQTITRSLYGPQQGLLATSTATVARGEPLTSATSDVEAHSFFFTDHKSSVTHKFDTDATLIDKLEYDDFGCPVDNDQGNPRSPKRGPSYEGNSAGPCLGLIDFGARIVSLPFSFCYYLMFGSRI